MVLYGQLGHPRTRNAGAAALGRFGSAEAKTLEVITHKPSNQGAGFTAVPFCYGGSIPPQAGAYRAVLASPQISDKFGQRSKFFPWLDELFVVGYMRVRESFWFLRTFFFAQFVRG